MPNNNKRLAWFSIIGDKSALLISTFLNGLVCFGGAIFKLATFKCCFWAFSTTSSGDGWVKFSLALVIFSIDMLVIGW